MYCCFVSLEVNLLQLKLRRVTLALAKLWLSQFFNWKKKGFARENSDFVNFLLSGLYKTVWKPFSQLRSNILTYLIENTDHAVTL